MRPVARVLIGAMLIGAASLWPAASLRAQADPPDRIARLSDVEGAVSLRPAGLSDWSVAPLNQPLTSGDQLWSDPGARAEIDLGSAVVRFDESSSVSLLGLTDDLTQLQVNAGSVDVIVRGLEPAAVFEVDAPDAAVGLLQPGEYRLSVDGDGTTRIAVRGGQAQAAWSAGPDMTLATGQLGVFGANGSYGVLPVSAPDDFDLWCRQREADWADAGAMAQYVSSDAVGYQDLQQYGDWQAEPDYGEVWFPTQLAVGWAPYSEGHWAWIAPWGWSWVDQAPWGFAPYHYGRWTYISGRWGWVPPPPRRHAVYAPALVAWVGGPGTGASLSLGGGTAVGWLPLAPGEVYVPGFSVSARYLQRVNLSNSSRLRPDTITAVANDPARQLRYANSAVPRALTVVAQTTFTQGEPVLRNRIATPSQLQSATPSARVLGIAPERASLSGPVALSRVAHPPPTLLNQAPVTRHEPPPPPPAFELQQAAVRANGGLPIDQTKLSQLSASEPARYYAAPAVSAPAVSTPPSMRLPQRPPGTASAPAPAAPAAEAGAANTNTYRAIPERPAQFKPPSQTPYREPPTESPQQAQPRVPVAPTAPVATQGQAKSGKRPPETPEPESRGSR